jgi:hypothetical protein
MGTGSIPGVNPPVRDVDSPPHLAPRLKKGQSYTSTPPLGFRGLFHGDLYFYLYITLTCRTLKPIVHTSVHNTSQLPSSQYATYRHPNLLYCTITHLLLHALLCERSTISSAAANVRYVFSQLQRNSVLFYQKKHEP